MPDTSDSSFHFTYDSEYESVSKTYDMISTSPKKTRIDFPRR